MTERGGPNRGLAIASDKAKHPKGGLTAKGVRANATLHWRRSVELQQPCWWHTLCEIDVSPSTESLFMFAIRWLTIPTLLVSSVTFAHDGSGDHAGATPQVPPSVVWKATAIPDRIVLSWELDPATTMSVSWRTDSTVKHAVAEIAEAEPGPNFVQQRRSIDAKTERLDSNGGVSLHHSVTFEGLLPGEQYTYRVGDGTNWSEWADFETASSDPKPFSFVYFGDAQNSLKSLWSRVVRRAYREAPKASFFLHAGDLVNTAENDAEWGEWFYAGGFIHRSTPCVATPGNHEYGRIAETEKRRLSIHWRSQFTFPKNGPEGLQETTYWFDFQGTRFVSLNSNAEHEVQAEWLDRVLSDNPNKWTVLTFHHPMYSASAVRDNPHLRALWQPVIDKHHVDLVLQGHDHTYARSQLMTQEVNLATGVSKADPRTGTVYVVSVSGPKMYELGRRPFMRRAAEDTQLFQIITIDGEQLLYEARTATWELYDGFVLRKEPGARRALIEQMPGTKENRRPESEREKRPTAKEVVAQWLKEMDKNGDRQLVIDELLDEYRVYFGAIDKDNNGFCSEQELLEAARSLAGAE